MLKALDTASTTSSMLPCLLQLGYRCIIRYYTKKTTSWKLLKSPEAEAISEAGLELAVVYQDRNNQPSDFSGQKGLQAGNAAFHYARDVIGQPFGSTIYFAVDYDASSSDITNHVKLYFEGVREAFTSQAGGHPGYRIGIYGSGLTCQSLLDARLVEHTWLSQSRGWRGTPEFDASGLWNLKQLPATTICGIGIDPDEVNPNNPNFGAFSLDTEDAAFSPGAPLASAITEMTTRTSAVPASTPVLSYPGRLIKEGELDSPVVQLIQERLNALGLGPLIEDGDFGENTEQAVMLFQARFTDLEGESLEVDGKIGSKTWGALFGRGSVPIEPVRADGGTTLGQRAIEVARTQIGVREQPPGSNRGPEVDEYVRSVGLSPTGAFPWCAAFIYWVYEQATKELGLSNPVPKTAGVLRLWNKAQGMATVIEANTAQPNLIEPGMVFCMDFGNGKGHTGLVARVEGDQVLTIEGNTNLGGSREGIGVFSRRRALHASKLLGYLKFS